VPSMRVAPTMARRAGLGVSFFWADVAVGVDAWPERLLQNKSKKQIKMNIDDLDIRTSSKYC